MNRVFRYESAFLQGMIGETFRSKKINKFEIYLELLLFVCVWFYILRKLFLIQKQLIAEN